MNPIAYTYFVTRTSSEPGPKFYFGYKLIKNDRGNYYGSSRLLKQDILKYGILNFKKSIVGYYHNTSDVVKAEIAYLTKINAAKHPMFYNKTNGNLKFSTAGVVYDKKSWKLVHPNTCLKGDLRTPAQKQGAATKYKARSDRRLLADAIHSIRCRLTNTHISLHSNRGVMTESTIARFREERRGVTKEHSLSRYSASIKLKGNKNGQTGNIRFAKMSEMEFLQFCALKSPHPNVQQMLKTRRLKGQYFLQHGTWPDKPVVVKGIPRIKNSINSQVDEKMKKHQVNEWLYVTPHGVYQSQIDIAFHLKMSQSSISRYFSSKKPGWYAKLKTEFASQNPDIFAYILQPSLSLSLLPCLIG